MKLRQERRDELIDSIEHLLGEVRATSVHFDVEKQDMNLEMAEIMIKRLRAHTDALLTEQD